MLHRPDDARSGALRFGRPGPCRPASNPRWCLQQKPPNASSEGARNRLQSRSPLGSIRQAASNRSSLNTKCDCLRIVEHVSRCCIASRLNTERTMAQYRPVTIKVSFASRTAPLSEMRSSSDVAFKSRDRASRLATVEASNARNAVTFTRYYLQRSDEIRA